MLVAQYSATYSWYAFVLVICRPFQKQSCRIELIIPFEVPPVLLKKLGGCCSADFGWLNIGLLKVPAGVPQAKHQIVYNLQTLRQLDINTDQ
jgi:hypothetical protein